jgi:hypothetical protein
MIINPYRFASDLGTQWDGYGQNSQEFDGSLDIATVTADATINNIFDGGGTAAVWVNVQSDGGADTGRILDKRASSGGWFVLTLGEVSGECKIRFSMDFTTTDMRVDTTALEITLNTWHHIAVTYDSSSDTTDPIMYIDGTALTIGSGLTEVLNSSGTAVSDASKNLVFANVAARNRGFDGSMCDVRLYDSILSAATIGNLANGYHQATDLVSWYPLLNNDYTDAVGTNDATNTGGIFNDNGPAD